MMQSREVMKFTILLGGNPRRAMNCYPHEYNGKTRSIIIKRLSL